MTEQDHPAERARFIDQGIPDQGLFAGAPHPLSRAAWRVAPQAFPVPPAAAALLAELGPAVLALYQAVNHLYLLSRRGAAPEFVARYLDLGKPEAVRRMAAMGRFKTELPRVLRPDILVGGDSWAITELDSVPGGIGLTACMATRYAGLGDPVVGGATGMLDHFAAALREAAGTPRPAVAVVIAPEAADYEPEMQWVADRLRDRGLAVWAVRPESLEFDAGRVLARDDSGRWVPIDLVYRFFELFDLPNIPRSEQLMAAVRQRWVRITPPYKHQLEEKLVLGLFHSPRLSAWWRQELGAAHDSLLRRLIPPTWILDPAPVPPAAVIPGLSIAGGPLSSFHELGAATQKERRLVLKVSGFSPQAWGARGVFVGHDLPQDEWRRLIEEALDRFAASPYVLQPFHKSRLFDVQYFDFGRSELCPLRARLRLSPYYFVHGGTAHLGGALATLCPEDKKLLHGMREAIMVPVAIGS